MPFERVPDLFVKKETVKGIIGKVQGMINPTRPPRNPNIKMPNRLFDLLSSVPVPPHLLTGLARSMDVSFRPAEAVADSCRLVDFAIRSPPDVKEYRKGTSTGPTTESLSIAIKVRVPFRSGEGPAAVDEPAAIGCI